MQIIPAIDLKGGRVVRLVQGDPAQETRYGDDPVAVALGWADRGAERLHVVDLDGAIGGTPAHAAVIGQIVRAVPVPVQVGGGLRSLEAVRQVLDHGVAVAVVGTAAIRDSGFLAAVCAAFPGRVALGLDARHGRLAVAGWAEGTSLAPAEVVACSAHLPLAALIYTDIARDGMLAGPDLAGLRAVAEAGRRPVIASGGIASVDDIAAVRRLEPVGVVGAILGKALYEGRLTLEAAIAAGAA
jgi:phosphoribosylformimino-5-aminoimidazole carboxamide ribotide isomerase